MSALRHPWLHRLGGLVLGGVFLWACVDKIAHPAEFARIVYHYRLIGPDARLGFLPANLLAVTLPWVELVTGLLLVVGAWRREAAAVSAGMLVMFLFAVSWALAQGIDLANCGCFTVSGDGRAAGLQLLAADTGLLLLSLVLALLPPRENP